jgi:hypothetical protein
MGISDEDYGTALIELKKFKALSSEQAKAIVEAVDEYTSTVTINAGTNTAVQMPYGHFKVLTENDLHNEAMKAPLSALVDMWLARWQGDWVSEPIFQEDDFWRITLVRLTGANKLEKHNLATQSSPVYRIIE